MSVAFLALAVCFWCSVTSVSLLIRANRLLDEIKKDIRK